MKRAEGNSMKNLILSGIETARKELVQLEEKLNCKNTKFESCSVACITGVRVRLGARLDVPSAPIGESNATHLPSRT